MIHDLTRRVVSCRLATLQYTDVTRLAVLACLALETIRTSHESRQARDVTSSSLETSWRARVTTYEPVTIEEVGVDPNVNWL